MQGIDEDEKILAEDERIQESIIQEYTASQPGPISWNGAKKVLLAGVALTSSAVITVAIMIIGYLIVTNAFAPRRLKYSMPLNLNLLGNDLVSNISLLSLDKYLEDGQVRDVFLLDQAEDLENQKPLLRPGQVADLWLELTIPPEYEKMRPERKYAHVTSTVSTYGGKAIARTSKPIYLNGRPSSAFNLLLSPWRWIGVLKKYHVVRFLVHPNYHEKRDFPSVFLATEIKARSAPGPEILDVSVHVAIRAGLIKKVLFYARPQSIIGKTLGFGSVVAILTAVGIILWCFQVYQFVPDSNEQTETEHDISGQSSDIEDTLDNSGEIKELELDIEEVIMEEESSELGQSLRKRR